MRLSNLFAALLGPSASPAIREATPATANPQPSVLITEADAPRSVRITPGQSLGIAVHDNASIGYVWHVSKLPSGLRSDGYHYPDPPSRAVGDGARKLFRFAALHRGRADLVLVRNFRGAAEKALKFDIRIE